MNISKNINWFNYIDHIFVINYINNNRYDAICKELLKVDIDIHKLSIDKFSFLFDIDYNILNNYINFENIVNDINIHINNISDFVIDYTKIYLKLGLNLYKILKISKFMNYERILILEDDAIFLKNYKYFNEALLNLNSLSFDMLLGQGYYGFNHNFNNAIKNKWQNEFFIRTDIDSIFTSYGAAFVLLTKEGINNIINIYESLGYPIMLDTIIGLTKYNLDILTVKKPLAIQDWYFEVGDDNTYKQINQYMDINEYK